MKDKKRIIILIGSIVAIALIVTVFLIFWDKETVSSHTEKVIIDSYELVIRGEPVKEKPEESYYTVSFKKKDKFSGGYSVIYVDFLGLTRKTDESTHIGENRNNDNIKKQNTISISSREYRYIIDNSQTCGQNILLYYDIPSSEYILNIRVRGGEIYSSDGYQAECLAMANKKTLANPNIKSILDYKLKSTGDE